LNFIEIESATMACCKGLAAALLVIVNFVFAAGGLLMLAFGIAAAVKPESIVEIFSNVPRITQDASAAGFDLEETIQSSAVFMIILGAVVSAIGLLGCIGACCRVKWMLGIYITALFLILLAEIALIIYAAVFPDHLEKNTRPLMFESLQKYKNDGHLTNDNYTLPSDETDLAWASLQFETGCCGAYGFKDYNNVTFTTARPGSYKIPISCCKLVGGPGRIPTKKSDFLDLDQCLKGMTEFINEKDCFTAVEELLKQYSRIAIGIAAAIIGVEIILILLSLYLCRTVATSTKSQAI
jgi:hypothetical protein